MTNGQRLLLRLAYCALILGSAGGIGFLIFKGTGAGIALVFAAPVAGVLLSRPLIEFTAEGWDWMAKSPLEPWNGRYYAFDDVQVRVAEEGEVLRLVAADACKAARVRVDVTLKLRIARLSDGMIEGTKAAGIPWTAAEALLVGYHGREVGRFLHWLRREVVAPWHRKRNLPFEVYPPR